MLAKRLFDLAVAALALLLFAPVIAVLALGVRWSMGSPVLFRQRRAGQGGREFQIAKFRTMREAYGADGAPLPDEQRVTSLGRFLRRSRLDELPEFWQVLTGAMSFVGPRPLPRTLLEQHGVLERRCQLRPGLTGLAQVSGNTLLSPEEKFAVDIHYAEHRSLGLDVAIIIATLRTVIMGEKRDEPLIRKAMDNAIGSDRRR